jgi:hypothetical protein
MKKLLFVLALLCVAVGTVQAQDVYQWFGGNPPTTNWYDGYAWFCEAGPTAGTFGVVPDAAAKVKLNNVLWGTPSAIIESAQSVTIGDIFMVDAGWLTPEDLTVRGTLDVVGAGAGAEGQINIGYAVDGTAGLIIDGGVATVAGPVHVGWGGNGSLLITAGGSLSVMALDFGGAGGAGVADVQNGELRIAGYVADVAQQWVDDGLLKNSLGDVVITYDENADVTIITPEPISIALLGLGALFLRKRS